MHISKIYQLLSAAKVCSLKTLKILQVNIINFPKVHCKQVRSIEYYTNLDNTCS